VLANIRERLLHGAVDRRLEFGHEPGRPVAVLVRELDGDIELDPGVRESIREIEYRGLDTELVERAGAQIADQRPQAVHVQLQLRDRAVDRLGDLLRIARPARRCQREPDARQRLQSIVVQFARPAAALSLGRRDTVAAPLVRRRLCRADGHRRACCERLEQPLLFRVGSRPLHVERHECPDDLAAESHRHNQPVLGAHASPAGTVLMKPIQVFRQPLSRPSPDRRAGNGGLDREPLTDEVGRELAGAGGYHQLAVLDELDRHHLRRHERSAALGDHLQDRLDVVRARDGAGDVGRRTQRFHGLGELRALALDIAVPACVVDRDRCVLGEQQYLLLVLVGELGAALLLGQVEVSERNAVEHHWNTEERLHPWVIDREPVGMGVATDVGHAQRRRVIDQLSEHAAAGRQRTDPLAAVVVDPEGQESRELLPRVVQHPECRVPRARQLACGLQHSSQYHLGIEVGEDRADYAEESIGRSIHATGARRDTSYRCDDVPVVPPAR
jgi:hypothetical protein